MTENSKVDELDEQLNEAFDRLEKKEPIPAERASQQSSASPVALLAMFLALVAVGMASYPIYLLEFRPSAPVAVNENLASPPEVELALESLRQSQSRKSNELQQQLAEISARVETKSTVDAVTQDSLNQTVTRLRQEMFDSLGTSRQDWIFAEVEYLLRLANQRLLMEKDPVSAIALLRSADELIRENEGLAAFELRESVSADLIRLASIEDLDVDGLYLQLSALASEVERLPRRPYSYLAPAPASDVEFTESQTLSERLLVLIDRAGSRLATLVDYRRDGEVITPVLPPQEEYYLRQNLILKFQIAQLALLRRDGPVYQSSLSEARVWIDRYFDLNDGKTRALISTIDVVGAVDITRNLPDISKSLRIAKRLMTKFESQDRHSPAPAGTPSQEAPL